MIKRYQIPELESLCSEEAKYKRWSLLEREVLYSLKNHNILNLSESQIKELEHNWKTIEITELEVQEEEKETKHDFVAFLNVLEKKLSTSSISKYLHYGLTSSDIIDSATSLFLREVNNKLVKWIEELQLTLSELAYKCLSTVQIGRTHGRHAEPISFGAKFAICYQELNNSLEQLYLARRFIEVITIKGATGSYAHISSEIQEDLAHRLGLFTILCTTQALPRNRHSTYLFTLSQIGKVINSLVVNLRTLAREEITEISLEPTKSQVGSSAMPHKTNPVSLENISGLSRWLDSLSYLAHQNIELWDERDISHSSNERMSLIDAPILLGNIVLKTNSFLKGLRINEFKLKENLDLTKGLIHSQIISLALLEQSNINSRKEARQIISQITRDIREGKSDSLKSALSCSNYKESKAISVLSEVESLNYYLKYYPALYKQIFSQNSSSELTINKYEIDNAIHYLAQRINWYYGSKLSENEKVIVISFSSEPKFLSAKLISLLNFPLTIISLPYSFEDLSKKFKSQIGLDSCFSQQEFVNFIQSEIKNSHWFEKILELSQQYSKVLIVKDIVYSGEILKALYSELINLSNIQEIKSISLFLKVLNSEGKLIFNSEYYKPSLFSSDFYGSLAEREMREFNFKEWNHNSSSKLVNWFGFLIS